MVEKSDKLFEMTPQDSEGTSGGEVQETWKDVALERSTAAFRDAPLDKFDRQSVNHPKTDGQLRGETIEGLTPRQASRSQTAAVVREQTGRIFEESERQREEQRLAAADESTQRTLEVIRTSFPKKPETSS